MDSMEMTPGQTSASDLNPTTTSPSASSSTGDAVTSSLLPSSASPSTPPTTTTTQLNQSAPPQPISLLPSSPSQITTTQPLPSAPSLSIQETGQESISFTSGSDATPELAGPSTASSASLESMTTLTVLQTMEESKIFLDMAMHGVTAVLKSLKEEYPEVLQEIADGLACKIDAMGPLIESLIRFKEYVRGDERQLETLEMWINLELLDDVTEVAEMILAEINKRQLGSCGFCGGSMGEGGDPDSGSSGGDGGGGGVGV